MADANSFPVPRRTFLGLLTASTATVVVGETEATESAAARKHAADSYRETDHIRSAYERMRF